MLSDPLASSSEPAAPSPDPHATTASIALRNRAEARRRQLVTHHAEGASPADLQRLVQELQIHQIELEMQNEELMLAQNELLRARAQYVDLYDFAPVGYVTLNEAGVVEQLNLSASRLLGATRAQLQGRRFALFVALPDRPAFHSFLTRALATEHGLGCELQMLRHDGTTFFAQVEALRAEEQPGGAAGRRPSCRLVLSDSTARRAAADAIAASEARFRTLFEQSSDGMLLLEEGRFVEANAVALRLLSLSDKKLLLGQPVGSFSPVRQPDGRLSRALIQEHLATAHSRGWCRFDWCMTRPGGREMWLEITLTPVMVGTQALTQVAMRDSTAQRAAQLQLRESEERLQVALKASDTGVFVWDQATELVHWDERTQAAFGYPPGGALAGPVPLEVLTRAFHPADADRMRAVMAAAVANGTRMAVNYRVVWPDGSVHHVYSAGQLIEGPQGAAFFGVLRDVTDLHTAEEELNYKSLVLEHLLSHMPMALTRFGPDGECLEAVGQGLKTLGLPAGDLVGRRIFSVFPDLRAPVLRTLHAGKTELLHELRQGATPVAFQNYGFFDEERQQAVVLSIDVSDTVRQQRQLQAERDFSQLLLETSVDGIVALDLQGCIRAWNEQAQAFFGVAAAEALGRPLFDVLPQLDHAEARQVVARVLAGEAVVCEEQQFGPQRAGQYDAHHLPLRDAAGQVGGVLILFRDVTERNRLAREAAEIRERQHQQVVFATLEAQESERRRIAESLHNGLGQLLYATKLTLSGPATPAVKAQAGRLLEEAIRSTRTISFELTPGVLNDFGLAVALQELVGRLPQQPLPVRLHLQDLDPGRRLPAAVEIAAYRICQELINNVIRHAHATEAALHVTLVAGLPAVLRLLMRDNGRGFSPASLDVSAGIGLRGIRNRVELLNGTIRLHSEPNQGTSITVELPADAEAGARPAGV